MPYYSGDYYQAGDNYAAGGLFGSIGKFLGGAVKKLGGTALSLIPGGGLVSKAASLISSGTAGRAIQVGRSLVGTRAGRAVAPLVSSFGAIGGPAELPMIGAGGGFGGAFGRSRRMNVTNVRALRRAGRRVRGFLKLARRFGALPISPKGKKLFRAKRRAR